VSHNGWKIRKRYFETPRGIRPSLWNSPIDTSPASGFLQCLGVNNSPCSLNKKSRERPRRHLPEESSKSSRESPSLPHDMSAMATITSRLDAHAAETRQLMQRDALHGHAAPIVVDQPFLPPRPPPPPPLFRHDSLGHPRVSGPHARPAVPGGRHPTIDPVVLGRTTGETADFDRDAINIGPSIMFH
jgi:hypothetical protein